MNLETKILINEFGQSLELIDRLVEQFENYHKSDKKRFLEEIIYLIIQSDVNNEDIEPAVIRSKLKPTFTPCVLLRKGVNQSNLYRIIELPENEYKKILILFLSLFKVGYIRKYEVEKNTPNKWWFWDLSIKSNIQKIKENF